MHLNERKPKEFITGLNQQDSHQPAATHLQPSLPFSAQSATIRHNIMTTGKAAINTGYWRNASAGNWTFSSSKKHEMCEELRKFTWLDAWLVQRGTVENQRLGDWWMKLVCPTQQMMQKLKLLLVLREITSFLRSCRPSGCSWTLVSTHTFKVHNPHRAAECVFNIRTGNSDPGRGEWLYSSEEGWRRVLFSSRGQNKDQKIWRDDRLLHRTRTNQRSSRTVPLRNFLLRNAPPCSLEENRLLDSWERFLD